MFAIKQKFMRLFCHEVIPIFWDDLTPQKQAELRQALGGNGNYDVFPIAEVRQAEISWSSCGKVTPKAHGWS